MTVDRYSTSGQFIQLGTTTSAELTLKLSNNDGRFNDVLFEGKELCARIGYELNNETEWVSLGYFTVDETPRKLASITLSALDRMVLFDKEYNGTISFPITVKELLLNVCKDCGVALSTDADSLTNGTYNIPEPPDAQNITYRHLLQWIGELTGTCAYIDWDGKLRLEWYYETGFQITPADRYTSDVQEKPISLSGIQIIAEDKKDGTSEGKFAFQIENNPLIQHDVDVPLSALNAKLDKLTYLPFSCAAKSFPFLWPLDIITWVDKKGNGHKSLITHATHTMNGRSTLKAVGETGTKQSYSRSDPVTRQMVSYMNADFVKTKVFTATIANMDEAYIGKLSALQGVIEDLKVNDLEAIHSKFGTLETEVGNITTLLSGTTVSGSTQTIVLTAQNATLDDALIKNGIAARMGIGDLQAGTISTNRFTIASDDGGILLKDSTMQINDGKQVRVQIGRDASGDHNIYIYDKDGHLIFDAAGLTAAGASRPIITDLSVADDAHISGSKLDINSVVQEINDSSAIIKSSHIEFDETGQTLEVAFNKVSESVQEIADKKMYRVEITSSNGVLFKNSNIDTILTAHVYSWDEEITDLLPEEAFIWERTSKNPSADEYWNAENGKGKKQVYITRDDVDQLATFTCKINL